MRACSLQPAACSLVYSLLHATACVHSCDLMRARLRHAFDPSAGYAAGATLAASFSRREWIPCILLGWGVGGAYWSLFQLRPPGEASAPWRFI